MTLRRRRKVSTESATGTSSSTSSSSLLRHVLLMCSLLLPSLVESQQSRFPTEISLNAAVLHAPPFATVEPQPDGSLLYGGFQVDLLDRLTIFAAADNVTLNWNLSQAPDQYGPAFDLVADDCEQVVEDTSKCNQLDVIVGNFYATPDRALRVDLSPAWMRSSISTVKYTEKNSTDYTTLTQATNAGANVCLKDGTFYAGVVKEKFPDMNFLMCDSQDVCLDTLKREECVLYVDDELQLRYRAAWDYSLDVTRESFNTQYIVWPRSNRLDPIVSILLNRWTLAAVTNATLDELYHKYFQKALCPVGTAGESCELPCDPDHGASNVKGVCVCHSTKWTGDDCSIEVPENTNNIPSTLKYLAYGMFGINCVLIIGFGSWLMWQRKSTQVLVSQPFFLSLVLLGCLISSSTILALGEEDEGDGPVEACMAIPWLYSVGFSVTFGTLFAKIRRVFVIFRSAVDMRRNVVTVKETLIIIGAVLMIDVVLLVTWTVVDPLTWERTIVRADQFGEPLESEGHCTSEHWSIFAGVIAILHLLLLAVACYCCYVSRGIPTKFSEGKFVSVAMISNLQIFVVGVPILIILGADSGAGFFVRAVIIWMNDFVVITLIFGNLIYSVHWDQDDSNNQTVKAAAGHAIQQYSRSMRSMGSSRQMDTVDRSGSGLADTAGSLHSRSTSREFYASGSAHSRSASREFFPFATMNSPVLEGRRRSSGSRASITREMLEGERIPPMIMEGPSIETRSSRGDLLSSTHNHEESHAELILGSVREEEAKVQETETPRNAKFADIFAKNNIESASWVELLEESNEKAPQEPFGPKMEVFRDSEYLDASPSECGHQTQGPAVPEMKLSPAPGEAERTNIQQGHDQVSPVPSPRTRGKRRDSFQRLDKQLKEAMGAMADKSAKSEHPPRHPLDAELARALDGSSRTLKLALEQQAADLSHHNDHDRHMSSSRTRGKRRNSLQKLDDDLVQAMEAMADTSAEPQPARVPIDKELAEALEGSSGNLERALERSPSENETDQTSGFFELDDEDVERGTQKSKRNLAIRYSSEETGRTSGRESIMHHGQLGNSVSVGHA